MSTPYETWRDRLQPSVLPEDLRPCTPEYRLLACGNSHRDVLMREIERIGGYHLKAFQFPSDSERNLFLDELFISLYASATFLRWTDYEDSVFLGEFGDTKTAEDICLPADAIVSPGLLDRFDADRNLFVQVFGWARLSEENVACMSRHIHALCGGRAVEIGAGSGCVAQLLRQAPHSCDVLAYDRFACRGNPKMFRTWIRHPFCRDGVLEGGEEVVSRHGDRALLLLYPNEYAADCLRRYTGPLLIYVGMGRDSPTADSHFFDALSEGWLLLERQETVLFEGHPLPAALYVFRRRGEAELRQPFEEEFVAPQRWRELSSNFNRRQRMGTCAYCAFICYE